MQTRVPPSRSRCHHETRRPADHRGVRRRPAEEDPPDRRAGRLQQRDQRGRHHRRNQPARGRLHELRRWHPGVLQHGQRRGRHLRPQARDQRQPQRPVRQQPADGEGEPGAGPRVRDVRRHALFYGAPDLAASNPRCRRSRGTSTRSSRGSPTSSGPRRALLHVRDPGLPLRRSGGALLERRGVGLRVDRRVEELRGRREGELREVPVGEGRVLRPQPAGRSGRRQRPGLADEGEEGPARVHEHRPAGDAHPGQGDGQAAPRRGAVREQSVRPAVRARQRAVPRGRLRRTAVRALENTPQSRSSRTS